MNPALDPADMATAAAHGFRDGVAYVQKQAEIERVLNDMSKSSQESNMTQHDRDSQELRRLCQARDEWKAKSHAERTSCAQAVRTTLANWRCVPSAHLREFAELVIAEIEKPLAKD